MPPRRRRPALCWRPVLGAMAYVAWFVSMSVVGLVLHLNLPASRRAAAHLVNQALAGTFRGRIHLDHLGHLGLSSISDLDVSIYEPSGHRVVLVQDAAARYSVAELTRALMDLRRPVRLTLFDVDLAYTDVVIEQDADGSLTLLQAFEPSAPGVASPSRGRGVSLLIPNASVGLAWVHGRLAGRPPIDGSLLGIRGGVASSPSGTAVTVRRLRFEARSLPAGDVGGNLEGGLIVPSASGDPLRAAVAAQGRLGGVPVAGSVRLSGHRMEGSVTVERTSPEAYQAIFSDVPLHAPTGGHVRFGGTLARLRAVGDVGVGDGTLRYAADVHVGASLSADVKAVARALRARDFLPSAPDCTLGARISVDVTSAAGQTRGTYDVKTDSTSLEGQVIPPIHAGGAFVGSSVTGRLTASEDGADVDVVFELSKSSKARKPDTVRFDLHASAPTLSRLRWLRGRVEGQASAGARGVLTFANRPIVDAKGELRVSGLRARGASLAVGAVALHASGDVSNPMIQAQFEGRQLRAGDLMIDHVVGLTWGAARSPEVEVHARAANGDFVRARARLALDSSVEARDVRARLSRHGQVVTVSTPLVRAGGGRIDLDRLRIEGLGAPATGAVHLRPGETTLRLVAKRIDLPSLALLIGRQVPVVEGALAVDGDLRLTSVATTGHLRVELTGAMFAEVGEASGTAEARFDGHRVSLNATASAGRAVRIWLSSGGAIDGSALRLRTWKRWTGDARLDGAIDLALASRWATKSWWPLPHGSGVVRIRAQVDQRQPAQTPDALVQIATQRLALPAVRSVILEPADPKAPSSLQLDEVDVVAAARLQGEPGKVSIALQARKGESELLKLGAEAVLPIQQLVDAPSTLRASLLHAPATVFAEVPRRRLSEVPSVLRPAALEGEVDARVWLTGTAREPRGDMQLHAYGLRARDPTGSSPPMELHVGAQVLGARGAVEAAAVDASGPLGGANAQLVLGLDKLAGGHDDEPWWTGSSRIVLTGVPLHVLGGVVRARLLGCVYGDITVRGLHHEASLDGALRIEGLRVGRARPSRAELEAHLHDGRLTAQAEIRQTEGWMRVDLHGAAPWRAALLPAFSAAGVESASLRANDFDLSLFQPLLRGLGRIDGRLDGDMTLKLSGRTWHSGSAAGFLEIRDGSIDSAVVGQRLQNIHVRVRARPDGLVELNPVSVEGLNGQAMIAGAVRMAGLEVQTAAVVIRVSPNNALPFTYQGERYGDIAGELSATAVRREGARAVDVDVSVAKLDLELPPGARRQLQSLDDDPSIEAGVQVAHGIFRSLALRRPSEHAAAEASAGGPAGGPFALRITTTLGNNVVVRRDPDLNVQLSGRMRVVIEGGRTQAEGALEATHGTVDIQGRQFEISHATLSFNADDPSDPIVTATATYDAPGDYRVIAEYIGTAQSGQLSLRSQPPLSEPEILSLIAFGTPAGAGTTNAQGGSAGVAAAAAFGSLTTGLNAAIGRVSPLDLSTRVDTRGQDPRPEVVARLARNVTAAVSYRVGLRAPGDSPDRVILTVDYQFNPRWSLSASTGDASTSIFELLWRYRY